MFLHFLFFFDLDREISCNITFDNILLGEVSFRATIHHLFSICL